MSMYSEFKSANGDKKLNVTKCISRQDSRSPITFLSISLSLSYDLLLRDCYLIKHLIPLLLAPRQSCHEVARFMKCLRRRRPWVRNYIVLQRSDERDEERFSTLWRLRSYLNPFILATVSQHLSCLSETLLFIPNILTYRKHLCSGFDGELIRGTKWETFSVARLVRQRFSNSENYSRVTLSRRWIWNYNDGIISETNMRLSCCGIAREFVTMKVCFAA